MGDTRARRTTTLWTHSLKTLTLIAWIGVWTQRTAGQGPGAEVITAAEGQTATLTAPVTARVLSFAWYRGTATVDPAQVIISYVVPTSEQITGPLSTGRESVSPNGTLHIRDLRTSDTGNYTVLVTLSTGVGGPTASRQLQVYEPVTKPTVKYISSQLVENQGPAEITCDTSSAAVTILWYFNSTSTLPGNIIQSPNNRTLTITNVSRGDSGIYVCEALNPVSSKTSDPQTLTVAYGPEDVKIDPPGSQVLQVGAKLSLSCTAWSFPAPQYKWFLNNTDLKRPGHTYTVEKVSSRDKGNYTCVAENTVTGLSVKASVFITVNGTDPAPDNGAGLPVGAIVGIVIGVLAVVIIVCVLVYIFVIKKPASGGPAAGDSTEMAPKNKEGSASPKANGAAPEIQYSSVNFVPKRTPAKPVSPENTVYSEVRR